jgi:hypothetical protein
MDARLGATNAKLRPTELDAVQVQPVVAFLHGAELRECEAAVHPNLNHGIGIVTDS